MPKQSGNMKRPHNRTGRQRYYITFQNPVTTFSTDGTNTPSTAWVNVQSLWAEIEQASGGEVVWTQQVQAEEVYTISCRWFATAGQAERITLVDPSYGLTRIFNIIQSNDVGSLHTVLELTVAEMDPEI